MRKALILIFLITTLVSCKNETNKTGSGKTVFRYNEPAGITSLDPAFSRTAENIWAVNQLFNGLVQMNDKLEVEPCIAKGWNISEDGLIYSFTLRNDVFFHDHPQFPGGKGRRVVAGDFVSSFYRISSKDLASPGAWIFNNLDKSAKNNYLGFTAPNDTTFYIFLQKPFPPFLGLLTMQYCSVIPHEVVQHYGNDFRVNPVGTGPFKFKMWKEGERLVLLKNTNYFEKDEKGERLPYLDAVSVSFIKDRETGFLEFLKGNFDFLSEVDASFKDDLLTKTGEINPKQKGKFKMNRSPYLKVDYLGFLIDNKSKKNNPFLNKKVRQAINYAINREKMITYLRNNIGKPAHSGFIPNGIPSFDESIVKGYKYDPDKARRLLREADYPDGAGLPEIPISATALYLDLLEFVQNELKAIGIKVKIDVLSTAAMSEMVARGDVPFFRKSWIADYPDAENFLAPFYSKNFAPEGPNYTHFSNKEFDELYEKSQLELDDEKRYELYRKMDQIIIDEAPVVPLYYDEAVTFHHNNIRNFNFNPMKLLVLKRVQKDATESPSGKM